ncbi:MAG TPA: DUF5989 family protein [Chloroflexia bacterium]|jgi:hypothetical protein|nr:DUF5989 family protein [Chloroflexia bacterium]
MRSRLSVLGGLFGFMVQGSRKYWLLPLVIALMVVVLAIVIGGSSVLAPFIYPLF